MVAGIKLAKMSVLLVWEDNGNRSDTSSAEVLLNGCAHQTCSSKNPARIPLVQREVVWYHEGKASHEHLGRTSPSSSSSLARLFAGREDTLPGP